MMPHILSVGNDPTLMASRTLILRAAGYLVAEAHTVEKAITLVEADSIDITLICHTVPKRDQQTLIWFVRDNGALMPIICIRSYSHEATASTCIAVDNDPEELLNTVRRAVRLSPLK